ncbi:glycosyltransferase family 1 [Fusarium coicis]|nr:glycosyltransferase family 1 [Fusarium coicis]
MDSQERSPADSSKGDREGLLVDVPLALTKGLHNLPELYGEKVRKHDKVTDWKSGIAEAGKKFAYNFLDASWCLFKQPAVGAVKGGPLGLVTGLGKADFGQIAEPGSGSLSKTEKKLLEARLSHDEYFAKIDPIRDQEVEVVSRSLGVEQQHNCAQDRHLCALQSKW